MAEHPPIDPARHWDAAYGSRGTTGVSWYQAAPTVSLELIDALHVARNGALLDLGGGASSLVDHLVGRGFGDVTVLDVSDVALDEARRRLGPDAPVTWIRRDLLSWAPPRRYDLWHDRAVFHFLTEDAQRPRYLDLLGSALGPGAGLVVATFAEDGPELCSGLPVARYSAGALSDVFGDRFEVIETRREVHRTPGGASQPFTWLCARRTPGREV